MTNLYPFIQGSLQWPFSELFPLMYRYGINTNILHLIFFRAEFWSFRIKCLSLQEYLANEKTNELTICGILCRNVTIVYRQELAFLFQDQEKLNACRSSKLSFSSSFFIADDSHVKIVWLHVVVFSEHNILHFWDMSICLNIIQWNCLKIALILSVSQVKPVYKFPNFRLD